MKYARFLLIALSGLLFTGCSLPTSIKLPMTKTAQKEALEPTPLPSPVVTITPSSQPVKSDVKTDDASLDKMITELDKDMKSITIDTDKSDLKSEEPEL